MANIAINATAEQIERMANMEIDEAPAQDSANLVLSGGVFSAVDEVSTALKKAKNLELWNEITLDEDTNIVSISQTDSGTSFQINKLFIFFDGKLNKAGNITIRMEGGIMIPLSIDCTTVSSEIGVWCVIQRVSKGIFYSIFPEKELKSIVSGNAQGINAQQVNLKSSFMSGSNREAKRFTFGAPTSDPELKMLAGSKIYVWGEQLV